MRRFLRKEFGMFLGVVALVTAYFLYEQRVYSLEASRLAKAETLDELRRYYSATELTCYESADGHYLVVLPLQAWTVRSGPAAVLFDQDFNQIQYSTELGDGSDDEDAMRQVLIHGRKVDLPTRP
ncbi:hypothetical protein GYB59_13505 [bacterium]|nr:hypothetical protein [bacterium]